MPQFIPDHPDVIAAAANAELQAEGITDLRFDALPAFRSRRAMAEIDAPQSAPEATPEADAGPSPAEAVRARLGAVLRASEAKGKVDASLSLALDTDITTEQLTATLRDLPDGVDLGLPPKAIDDPEAKAEADRIRQIVTADAAAGHHDHAVALALETDTPVAAALAILSAMPAPLSLGAIEARFSDGDWFGEDPTQMEAIHGDQTAAGWSTAVAAANARFETSAPSSQTEPQAPGGPRFGADQ